ncbi:MAG: GNAT family N-acetyltransferase [Bacillota bacterium]|jgi:ribosomal-protein-alanine N-acetyltransferase|nr:GNAT family N-acetyltransferase [Bacillota bacterium]HOC06204.1 GNAT family protein [Bacillota bacterium]HPZ22067.1 GNAT family protein [Bacillota bacterium]HQD19871.1 GNAT family protein [Bacillota bacterium]
MLNAEAIFRQMPTLETRRLLLRPLCLEDAKDMYDYACDPLVSRYVPWETHRSIEDSYAYLNSAVEDQQAGKPCSWAVVSKAENRMVGTAGYVWWQPEHSKAEIGYVLARRLWGQGLTSEAVKTIIDFGFTRMELNRIEARCIEENIASAKVMEKCGMTREGRMRDYLKIKGTFCTYLFYSILRREWEEML